MSDEFFKPSTTSILLSSIISSSRTSEEASLLVEPNRVDGKSSLIPLLQLSVFFVFFGGLGFFVLMSWTDQSSSHSQGSCSYLKSTKELSFNVLILHTLFSIYTALTRIIYLTLLLQRSCWQLSLLVVIQFLWCLCKELGIGLNNNPLIEIFLNSPQLPAWYCIDIVGRNWVLKLTQATSLDLSHPSVEALMAESVSTFF